MKKKPMKNVFKKRLIISLVILFGQIQISAMKSNVEQSIESLLTIQEIFDPSPPHELFDPFAPQLFDQLVQELFDPFAPQLENTEQQIRAPKNIHAKIKTQQEKMQTLMRIINRLHRN